MRIHSRQTCVILLMLSAPTLFSQDTASMKRVATTFLGGQGTDDSYEPAIAVDHYNQVIVSGYTASSSFPVTQGTWQQPHAGGTVDRFIAKLDANLKTVTAATYFGGTGVDIGMGLAISHDNHIYIAGYTTSTDLETTSGAYDPTHNGGRDVFIAKFSQNLDTLLACTYLGGSESEGNTWPRIDLVVGKDGRIIVAGLTQSANFPTTQGAYNQYYSGGPNGGDAFIAILDADLTTLIASTFIGGSGDEWRVSVLESPQGDLYLCGETESSNFPLYNGYDTRFNGTSDAFVAKFSADLRQLKNSTVIGGSLNEEALAMRLSPQGQLYLAGYTRSYDFPVTPNVLQPTPGGGDRDGFLAQLDTNLKNLLACTRLGGNDRDDCRDLWIDSQGWIYVTGNSASVNLPLSPDAEFSTYRGGSPHGDAFIAKINPQLSALGYASYLGGTGDDAAYAIIMNPVQQLYITGITTSTDFPTTPDAFDSLHDGVSDCFIAQYDSCLSPTSTAVSETSPQSPGPDLHANYPNPFNPKTTLTYSLHDPGWIRLSILNLRGQTVKILVDEWKTAGQHQNHWLGDDNHGQPMASGIYLSCLVQGSIKKTGRLLLMR